MQAALEMEFLPAIIQAWAAAAQQQQQPVSLLWLLRLQAALVLTGME